MPKIVKRLVKVTREYEFWDCGLGGVYGHKHLLEEAAKRCMKKQNRQPPDLMARAYRNLSIIEAFLDDHSNVAALSRRLNLSASLCASIIFKYQRLALSQWRCLNYNPATPWFNKDRAINDNTGSSAPWAVYVSPRKITLWRDGLGADIRASDGYYYTEK